MTILTISSSYDPFSRSEKLARLCSQELAVMGGEAPLLMLKDHPLPPFDNGPLMERPAYRKLHAAVTAADALVLASPVYNWGCCAELKKFVEYIGSTPQDGSVRGAFFDKVVTFVNAGGVPHSYTSFTELANALMLDFKCIVNPYHVYVHNEQWEDGVLATSARERLGKAMRVTLELATLLQARTYRSKWEL